MELGEVLEEAGGGRRRRCGRHCCPHFPGGLPLTSFSPFATSSWKTCSNEQVEEKDERASRGAPREPGRRRTAHVLVSRTHLSRLWLHCCQPALRPPSPLHSHPTPFPRRTFQKCDPRSLTTCPSCALCSALFLATSSTMELLRMAKRWKVRLRGRAGSEEEGDGEGGGAAR